MTEEEITRLRSYLAAQSMRRTPGQILEALQEAHHQFVEAIAASSSTMSRLSPNEHAWSVFEIVEHVSLFMARSKEDICKVLEMGERPSDVCDRQGIIPRRENTDLQEELLVGLKEVVDELVSSVYRADPSAFLTLTWKHFELGDMHWREWLLFSRVHLLDHVHQVQQMPMLVE